MKLSKLSMNNFLCFGSVDIDFSNYGNSVLILGDNRDLLGADSNESGKSSLLDAIPWNLFGDIPSDISVNDIIRRGANKCKVYIEFEDDKTSYSITRERISSKEGLVFKVNGEDISLRKTSETQQLIFERLDFIKPGSKVTRSQAIADFFNTVYFSPLIFNSFASQATSSSERLKIISRFLGLERLDKAHKLAKEEGSLITKELVKIESLIGFISEKIEGVDVEELEKRKNNLEEDLSKSEKDRLKLIQVSEIRKKHELLLSKKDNYNDSIASEEASYVNYRGHLRNDYDEIIEEIDSIKNDENSLGKVFEEIESMNEKQSEYEKVRNILEDLRSDYESEILEKIEEIDSSLDELKAGGFFDCPACGEKLLFDKDGGMLSVYDEEGVKSMIDDLEDNKSSKKSMGELIYGNKILDWEKRLEEIEVNGNVAVLIDERTRLQYNIEKLAKLKDRSSIIKSEGIGLRKEHEKNKLDIKEKISNIDSEIEAIPDYAVRSLNIESITFKCTELAIEISKISVTIETYKKDLKTNEEYNIQLKNIEKNLRAYSMWEEGFPKIRKDMIYEFLPSLEGSCNNYLKMMDAGIEVIFDIDFVRVNNEFKILVDDGVQSWSFEQRSRGMQSRIALAIGLGLGDLAKFDRSVSFDFRLFDEVADSLDSTGVGEFIKILDKIPGQKFIVSHNAELKKNFPLTDIITIIKENGVSWIE